MHNERLKKLQAKLASEKLDALLVTDINNVFYLSGFTGGDGVFIANGTDAYLLVDPRYTIKAKEECRNAKVIEYFGKSTIFAVCDLINELKPQKMGYEADNLTVATFNKLQNNIDSHVTLQSTQEIVESLRYIKDQSEIEIIKQACGIVDKTYLAVLDKIKPGITEKDVALMIDTYMRKFGADKDGFDTIVASGPNSACPHASPTGRILQQGDFLTMDFGARFNKYNSDITRTVCIGKPSEKHKEIYQVVLDAQLKAINAIAPGKTGKEIDAVARDYIASKGYGDNFGHSLGHSLGIQVHDGPGFSRLCNIILEPGMVITVEPGIYIEDFGGVRTEDDIIVTKTGVEVITKATKELICL